MTTRPIAPCPDCGGSGSENGVTGKGQCYRCHGTGQVDLRPIEELIEASSLGTPEAKALRERTPPEVVDRIMAEVKRRSDPPDFTLTEAEAIAELADVVGVIATVLSTHSDALVLRVQVDRCNRVINDMLRRSDGVPE